MPLLIPAVQAAREARRASDSEGAHDDLKALEPVFDGAYLLTGVEHTSREDLGHGDTLTFSQGVAAVGPIHPSLLGLHVDLGLRLDTVGGGSRLFVGNLTFDSGDVQLGTDSFQILSAGQDGFTLVIPADDGTQPAPPRPVPAPIIAGGKEKYGGGELDLVVLNQGPDASGQQGPTGDLSVVGEVSVNGLIAQHEADYSLVL